MPLLVPVLVACINATMSDGAAVKKLHEAEAALDEGDVETARSLASDVRDGRASHPEAEEPSGGLDERATLLYALSFVRDPNATDEELRTGESYLRSTRDYVMERGDRRPTPQLDANFGEALERLGKDDEAYKLLAPLATRDLMGSAYGYAALARIAARRGEAPLASSSLERCTAMAVRPAVCRGEYPRPPFFRGRPFDFAGAGFVVLAVALARLVRKRPWSGHAAATLSGAITVGGWGLFLLANARLGGLAAAAAFVFAFVLGVTQRRLFFRAASAGGVPGFRLRPLEPGDEHAPLLRLFFGPRETSTLEPTQEAGYRESARRPLLRFGRREVPGRWLVLAAVCALLLAGMLAATLTVTRGG